jgi:uncharacterized protein with NRDE domain
MLQQSNILQSELETTAWDILEDERKIITDLLPQTGISQDMEELLSSTFIQSPIYGTRCSNFLCMTHEQWSWLEKQQQGDFKGKITEQAVLFK